MVGQTVTQKIIARVAGRDTVKPGEFVMVSPDYTVGHELYWPIHQANMKKMGVDRFPNPEKVILVVDHTPQAALGSHYEKAHRDMKNFALGTGVENYYNVGNGGLRHFVMVEQGFARPGLFVFGDEPNIANIGVFGALCIYLSWEVIVPMCTDENWLQVPDSVRISLSGKLPHGVLIRDLVQAINRDYGAVDDMLPMCIEYTGPGIANLSLDARQSLLAGAYHSNAATAIMDVDDTAMAYVDERGGGRPFYTYKADSDAAYAFEAAYDMSTLEPYVTVPPEQHTVVPVGQIAGKRVDQATIGSCASSRLEDLQAAARILKGRKVARHVTFYVTPGSQEVLASASADGTLKILAEAGCAILTPGCTTCWGYNGVLNDHEVSISTHQENYRGRNGSELAEVYLASPYVVAASAVAGKIVDPRDLLN